MQNKFNRHIYRGILILSFIVLNVLILFGITSVLAYLNTGADRSTMLQTEVKSENVYLPKITWTNLENPGRTISNQELNSLQDNYLKSWYIKHIAYATNNPYGIEDFYTDSSRVPIVETIKLNKKQHITVDATTISHQPKLDFYSEDGKLAVITDENVIEFQHIYKDNALVLSSTDTSSYKVVLLLEDGFWRIRHKVKIKNEKKIDVITKNSFSEIVNNKISIDGKPFITKGINYYPQETPWDMFGDLFDIITIEKDFQLIKKANLNCIRIFIQYEDFGKEHVLPEKLKKLQQVLDAAERQQLKVVVTLFDFYGDYRVLNWTLTHRHAEQIVTTFKNHKAILAWDLKNEPDLDFESRQQETVTAWLSVMIQEIKKFDPNHLITIGWSSPEAASNLVNEVDFVSYHYYKNIENFEIDFQLLKNTVTNKPLVLQEFGITSYGGFWNLFNGSKTNQANYHKKMQAIFKKDSLAFMSWGLYDFKSIPTSVVGRLPWRKKPQQFYGFIDQEGNKKPSYLYISN